jgi:16S rRNA (uracil1498-N3)-methyltransferase
MNKVFCNVSDISDEKIIIRDPFQAHHLRDVLRLKPHDKAVIVDDKKNQYVCRLLEFKDKDVFFLIERRLPKKDKDLYSLTVACAVPKNVRMDDIINKLTQLGVDRIIPMQTGRSVVKLDKEKASMRLARWAKIALSAAGQSQRNDLPEVLPLTKFSKVIEEAEKFDLKIIPTLSGPRKGLKESIPSRLCGDIIVIIGPEGDFTEPELERAKSAGFIPVSLGNLVLRVDTAAICVAAYIKLSL